MKKLRIAVDLDDVLCKYVESLKTYCEVRLLRDLPFPESWEFSEQWGLTRDQLVDYMRSFALEGNFDYLPLVDDHAPHYLADWRAQGHKVKIVTARGHLVEDQVFRGVVLFDTARWLKKNRIEYDSLHFVRDKTEVPMDVLIDDSPDHLEGCWFEGARAVVMDRPYNRGWMSEVKAEGDVYRATSWTEINEAVTEIARRG